MILIIGIDPGATTGLSKYDTNRTLHELRSVKWTSHHAIMKEVDKMLVLPSERYMVGVELPRKAPYRQRDKSYGINYLMSIGQNIERARALIAEFHQRGVQVIEITPKRGWTKWKRDVFNLYFKWDGSSNEHSRDAACHAERARQEFLTGRKS